MCREMSEGETSSRPVLFFFCSFVLTQQLSADAGWSHTAGGNGSPPPPGCGQRCVGTLRWLPPLRRAGRARRLWHARLCQPRRNNVRLLWNKVGGRVAPWRGLLLLTSVCSALFMKHSSNLDASAHRKHVSTFTGRFLQAHLEIAPYEPQIDILPGVLQICSAPIGPAKQQSRRIPNNSICAQQSLLLPHPLSSGSNFPPLYKFRSSSAFPFALCTL